MLKIDQVELRLEKGNQPSPQQENNPGVNMPAQPHQLYIKFTKHKTDDAKEEGSQEHKLQKDMVFCWSGLPMYHRR